MLAIVATAEGPSWTERRDVAPPAPAPNEALVAVRAFAVNRGELTLVRRRDGWQPGQDVAGEVIQPAADGSGPAAGERIAGLAEWHGWGARAVVADAAAAEGPFDLVLESAGGASLDAAIERVAPGGTVIVFGNSSREPATLDFTAFFGHEEATIRTYFSARHEADAGRLLAMLLDLGANGRLHGE